jgi:translocation and assembly module TamB
MNSQISAQLRENKFQINQLKVDVPAAPLQLLLRGQGNLAGKNSQFATEISWQSLRWPLISTSYATKSASMAKPTDFLVYSQQGNLVASGNLDNYQLELRTKLEGKDIPQGDWHAVGKGDARHLQLESLQADVLEGALKLSGDVSWQPIVSWQVAINGTNLNPESQWKQWPGKLAVDLRNEGQLDNGGELQTLLEIKQLSGELRHYPLRLQTQLSMRLPRATTSKVKGFSLPVELAIKALELQSGNAQFTAYGNVGQQMNLTWNLDAPNIAAFFPESQGSIAGKGEVKGTLPLPSVMAELRGQKLRLQNSKLDSLRANVAFAADRDSQLMVFVDNFQQDNQHIKKISCTGNGKLTAHTLTTDIVFAEQNRLNLQLQGSFKQPRWQGELQQFNVSLHPLIQGNAEEKTRLPESVIHWQLQAPTALILSPTEVQLMPLCIHQNQTVQLCAQFKWQPQAKSILKVQLIELPLLTLTRLWLSPEQSLTGNINGMFEATLNPNGTLRSQGNINLSPGTVTWLEESFAHHGGNFALQINEKGLNSQVNFKLLEQSSIQGQLQLPQFTRLPPAPEQPLQGSIKLAFADLKILPTLMPQADNTEGRMSMDVFLSGTVTQPQIQGQLQLQNVAMDLIDLGIRINELNLVAKTVAQNNLTMQASMKSGEKGQLSATGEAQLVSLTDWQARLQLTGEAFEVVNTPDAWALASPDLSIKLLPSHIDVTGKVLVPEALITPTKVGSGAVTVSKDVVIVTSEEPNGPSAGESGEGKMAISSRVQIILGNKVTFKAAGFQSHFAGNVIASGQPRKVTMGNGELRITEGRYKAYGQDLKIDEGRVMFSGGPIENPGLDIKAYRQIKRQGDDEVIAGVHIQGTAQSPRLILYSSPSFDESNILSYLVLGKPAAQATQSEGNALLKAAASLSFDKSSALTRKIGKTFGLDEAGISTDKGLDEAEFVVGKYLTPELYISYGIGLFDTNQVVRMRYELTKRLTVETETGDKGQGVDLFYHFEH